MESLKIEYYEILEEKLPNLEMTFDQMEEDLESIKSENIQNSAEGSSSNALVTQPVPLLAPLLSWIHTKAVSVEC
ncbi:hypothetical protein TNCV_4051881 [Trichonephila clavipes]|nr:hypothetical protein TNCV_4051881 [Trichonephila clavipes]